MENSSSVLIFKLRQFQTFDDYITLHNLSMLLTYIVSHNEATRDVIVLLLCYVHNNEVGIFQN